MSAPFPPHALLRPPFALFAAATVWATYIGDATDRLDVAASASKVSVAFLALAPVCDKHVQPVTGAAKAIAEILDPRGLEAFNRMQRLLEHVSCDLWQLMWRGDVAAWENCVKQSFAAGMSLDLEEATVKYQVKIDAANGHQQKLVEHQWNAGSQPAIARSTVFASTAKAFCQSALTAAP
jgi:hypothetical protein